MLGDVDLPVETVFFGGGTPTLLPPDDLLAVLGAIRDEFGLAPGRRGDHGVEPGQRDGRPTWSQLRAGGINRISFGMQSAVPCRARRARPDPRPGAGARRRAVGRQAGLRAGEPRPHLRHARRVPRRLADESRGGARAGPRPPECVCADRRGRVRRWPAGWRAARSPRRTTTTWRTSTSSPTTCSRRPGCGGTRSPTGLGTTRRLVPTQPGLLARAATGGASGRAPTRTSAACGGGTSSTRRPTPTGSAAGVSPAAGPRGARRRDPSGRAGAAGDPAGRPACRSTSSTPRAGCRPGLVADGLVGLVEPSAPGASPGSPADRKRLCRRSGDQPRLVLTRRGRLLADAVVRALL